MNQAGTHNFHPIIVKPDFYLHRGVGKGKGINQKSEFNVLAENAFDNILFNIFQIFLRNGLLLFFANIQSVNLMKGGKMFSVYFIFSKNNTPG